MSDHTPGPWEAISERDGYGKDVWFIGHERAAIVAQGIHNRADANLIAAAPDLKEAVTAYLESRTLAWNAGLDRPTEVERQMMAALAKAEGRDG